MGFVGLVGGIENENLRAPFAVDFVVGLAGGFETENLKSFVSVLGGLGGIFENENLRSPVSFSDVFVGVGCSTTSIESVVSFLALGGNLNAGLSRSFNSFLTRSRSSTSFLSISSCLVSSVSDKGQFSRREGSHNAANLGP